MARSQRSVPAVHPERDALMRAILANPDDDLPKIVYADWQEEHGDPLHAELIRLLLERNRIQKNHANNMENGKWAYPPESMARLVAIEKRITFFRRRPRYRSLSKTWEGFDHSSVDVGKSRSRRVVKYDYTQQWSPGSSLECEWDNIISVKLSFNRYADRTLLESLGREHWLWRTDSASFTGARLTPSSLSSLVANHDMPGFRGLSFRDECSIDAGDFVDFLLGTGSEFISSLTFGPGTRFTHTARMRPSSNAMLHVVERMAASTIAKNLVVIVFESPEITEPAALLLLDSSVFRSLKILHIGRNRLSREIQTRIQERNDKHTYYNAFDDLDDGPSHPPEIDD